MNKIRNKRYRTPKGLERTKRVTLNLTVPEYEVIKRNAERAGVPFGMFARLVTLGGRVLARLDEEDRELLREAVGLSNDLHRLAECAREAGEGETADRLRSARNVVDELLNRVRL